MSAGTVPDDVLVASWRRHGGDGDAIAAEVKRERQHVINRLRKLGCPVKPKRLPRGEGKCFTAAFQDDGDGINRQLLRPWPEWAWFGPRRGGMEA